MSLAPVLLLDTYSIPRSTATAGTAIAVLVPPRRGKRAKISFLQITSGATAHTWYFLKELGRTTLATAAAGGAVSLVLTKDPGLYSTNSEYFNRSITPSTANNAVAANDYVVVQLKDGTYALRTVSAAATDSATGRVTLTVAAIGNAGAAAGTTVWFMGVGTDTDPHTNAANPLVTPATSATTTYPNAAAVGGAVVAQAELQFSPLVLLNANATAASVLDAGSAAYGE